MYVDYCLEETPRLAAEDEAMERSTAARKREVTIIVLHFVAQLGHERHEAVGVVIERSGRGVQQRTARSWTTTYSGSSTNCCVAIDLVRKAAEGPSESKAPRNLARTEHTNVDTEPFLSCGLAAPTSEFRGPNSSLAVE